VINLSKCKLCPTRVEPWMPGGTGPHLSMHTWQLCCCHQVSPFEAAVDKIASSRVRLRLVLAVLCSISEQPCFSCYVCLMSDISAHPVMDLITCACTVTHADVFIWGEKENREGSLHPECMRPRHCCIQGSSNNILRDLFKTPSFLPTHDPYSGH
jgi:hypothetical protein